MNIELLCWNMEWMNDLFDGDGNFREDNFKPQHDKKTTVLERRQNLAGVINELQPDVLVVVEGPNRTRELQLFFDTDVSGVWKTYIQRTKGAQQCIGIAVRVDTGKFDADNPVTNFDTANLQAFSDFELDNEKDGITEIYRFERKPAYAEMRLSNGERFRVLGLHLKSKGIFSMLEWSKWWEKSISNRRKIFATAVHLRTHFIEPYLTQATTKNIPLIVCGDINDGPGYDTAEKRIMGSGIEKLMGDIWKPQFILGNALYDTYQKLDISTTRYADPIFNFNYNYHYVWIDHILYSQNRKGWTANGRIIKDMENGKIWSQYPHTSDHQPVAVTLNLDENDTN
ncbi:MAG: hypothetical protein WBG71_01665 [Leeuwenhoekiella sp.]